MSLSGRKRAMLPGAMASELALFSLVVNQPGVLFGISLLSIDDNTMQDISAAAQTYQRKSQESVDGKFPRASQNSPSKSGLNYGTSQSPIGAPTEASLKTSAEYSPDSKAKLTAVAPEFVPPGASIAQASAPFLLPTNLHAVNHHLASAPDRWANDATGVAPVVNAATAHNNQAYAHIPAQFPTLSSKIPGQPPLTPSAAPSFVYQQQQQHHQQQPPVVHMGGPGVLPFLPSSSSPSPNSHHPYGNHTPSASSSSFPVGQLPQEFVPGQQAAGAYPPAYGFGTDSYVGTEEGFEDEDGDVHSDATNQGEVYSEGAAVAASEQEEDGQASSSKPGGGLNPNSKAFTFKMDPGASGFDFNPTTTTAAPAFTAATTAAANKPFTFNPAGAAFTPSFTTPAAPPTQDVLNQRARRAVAAALEKSGVPPSVVMQCIANGINAEALYGIAVVYDEFGVPSWNGDEGRVVELIANTGLAFLEPPPTLAEIQTIATAATYLEA